MGFATKSTNMAKSVKDLDTSSRRVRQYFSSWDLDDAKDRFIPGAWTKSIRERGPQSGNNRLKVLYQHLFYEPLATPDEADQDEKGMWLGFELPPTTRGNDTFIMYEHGVITEGSVGFDFVTDKYSKNDDGGFDIKEAVLLEGSPVTWGCQSNTPVISVGKSGDIRAAIQPVMLMMENAEKALHDGNWQTEDMPLLLEHQLKQWREAIKALIEAEPGESTQDDKPPFHDIEPDILHSLVEKLRQLNTHTGSRV